MRRQKVPVASDHAAINQMILATLKTKENREPKYRKELEALGFELINEHRLSSYDYWALRRKDAPKTTLVISTTYGRKRAVFDSFHCISKDSGIDKVDYWNLFMLRPVRKEAKEQAFIDEETKVDRYLRLKSEQLLIMQDIRHEEELIRDLTKNLKNNRASLDKITKELQALKSN